MRSRTLRTDISPIARELSLRHDAQAPAGVMGSQVVVTYVTWITQSHTGSRRLAHLAVKVKVAAPTLNAPNQTYHIM